MESIGTNSLVEFLVRLIQEGSGRVPLLVWMFCMIVGEMLQGLVPCVHFCLQMWWRHLLTTFYQHKIRRRRTRCKISCSCQNYELEKVEESDRKIIFLDGFADCREFCQQKRYVVKETSRNILWKIFRWKWSVNRKWSPENILISSVSLFLLQHDKKPANKIHKPLSLLVTNLRSPGPLKRLDS